MEAGKLYENGGVLSKGTGSEKCQEREKISKVQQLEKNPKGHQRESLGKMALF